MIICLIFTPPTAYLLHNKFLKSLDHMWEIVKVKTKTWNIVLIVAFIWQQSMEIMVKD
jgi:hypothetical protein